MKTYFLKPHVTPATQLSTARGGKPVVPPTTSQALRKFTRAELVAHFR